MEATVTRQPVNIRRLWKRYRGALFTIHSWLAIFLFYYTVSRSTVRNIDNFLQDYQGGTDWGLLLAYIGLSLTVVAQAYTVVKRIGIPEYIRKLGGAGLWLNIHIVVSLVGFFAILVHAGFPFQFRSNSGPRTYGPTGLRLWRPGCWWSRQSAGSSGDTCTGTYRRSSAPLRSGNQPIWW